MALVSRAPSDRLNVGMLKVHENKMIFLVHGVSGSLLRCVYCTCSYRDDDENQIYWAALKTTTKTI